MTYKGFTDAQARAHRKYMENTATITLTLSKEERDAIKKRAAAVGAPSVNRYILGLVRADLGTVADTVPRGDIGGGSAVGVTLSSISATEKTD